MRLWFQYAQLDGSHPDPDPVPNRHIVRLHWWRTELDLSVGVAPDLDVELDIPYDLKDIRARYELPDGTPFNNPQGDLHHRTERLHGISDLKLLANWRPGSILLQDDRLHVGIGLSLPAGRTEEDPYALGALGLPHQHIQFGTGTVDPVVRLDYALLADPVGFLVSTSAQTPAYENSKGFRGSPLIDFSVGPRVRLADWLVVGASYVASWQGRAFWNGFPDENSGYFLQGVSFTAPVRLADGVTIIPTVLRTFSIRTRGDADAFEMDWMAGVSLDVGF